jgi:hypothetical protein
MTPVEIRCARSTLTGHLTIDPSPLPAVCGHKGTLGRSLRLSSCGCGYARSGYERKSRTTSHYPVPGNEVWNPLGLDRPGAPPREGPRRSSASGRTIHPGACAMNRRPVPCVVARHSAHAAVSPDVA